MVRRKFVLLLIIILWGISTTLLLRTFISFNLKTGVGNFINFVGDLEPIDSNSAISRLVCDEKEQQDRKDIAKNSCKSSKNISIQVSSSIYSKRYRCNRHILY